MDPRWQQYADPATAAHRFGLASSAGHPPDNRDYAAPGQPLSHAPAAALHQAQAQARAQAPAQIHPQLRHAQAPPTATYGYDQHTPQHPPSLSSSLSSANTSQSRDVSGDVAMQDVNDSHAGIKYAMRPHHQHHLSGSGRPQSLHSPQEPSSAAQRYSPMEALSPTSSSSAYAPKPAMQSPYGGPVQRQSPTRQPDNHSSQSPYHPARSAAAAAAHQQHQQQQIPGMMPYSPHDAYQSSPPSQLPDSPYAGDPKSPRRNLPHGHAAAAATKRQVPEFSRIRSPADLRPKVNAQPPFRRAAPEGGFISVRCPSPSPSIPALLIPACCHCALRAHPSPT